MLVESMFTPQDRGSQDSCQSGLIHPNLCLTHLLGAQTSNDAAVLLHLSSPREPKSPGLTPKYCLPLASPSKQPLPVLPHLHSISAPFSADATPAAAKAHPASSASVPSKQSSCQFDMKPSCQPCPIRIEELVPQIQAAMDAEKAMGHVIDNSQDPTSLARLHAKVASLMQGYARQALAPQTLDQTIEGLKLNPNDNEGEPGIYTLGTADAAPPTADTASTEAALPAVDAAPAAALGLARSEDLDKHVFFNEHHYVRNLVAGNEDFELMVVCWQPGQISRVHNHGSSHCWLVVLEGEMEEVQYVLPGPQHQQQQQADCTSCTSSAGTTITEESCPALTTLQTSRLKVGDLGYISDKLALHTVGNSSRAYCGGSSNSSCGCTGCGACRGGVTLHLYAPPIRRVRLYEPDVGRVVERTPGFYSVAGQRV